MIPTENLSSEIFTRKLFSFIRRNYFCHYFHLTNFLLIILIVSLSFQFHFFIIIFLALLILLVISIHVMLFLELHVIEHFCETLFANCFFHYRSHLSYKVFFLLIFTTRNKSLNVQQEIKLQRKQQKPRKSSRCLNYVKDFVYGLDITPSVHSFIFCLKTLFSILERAVHNEIFNHCRTFMIRNSFFRAVVLMN